MKVQALVFSGTTKFKYNEKKDTPANGRGFSRETLSGLIRCAKDRNKDVRISLKLIDRSVSPTAFREISPFDLQTGNQIIIQSHGSTKRSFDERLHILLTHSGYDFDFSA